MAVKVTDTAFGRQIYFDNDVYFGPLLETYGEYSPGETDLFRQLVKPGDVVVDAGANIGAHTLALANFVGREGRVVAFEPQRPMFYALCGSLALNSHWNVTAYQVALGAEMGVVRMGEPNYDVENSFGSVGVIAEGNAEVPVWPLDMLELPQLAFVKMDIEGSERDALDGAARTIARCRPILYVEADRSDRLDPLVAWLRGAGYNCWLHTPPIHRPDNWRGSDECLMQHVVAIMLLCLPVESPIEVVGLLKIESATDMPEFGLHDWRANKISAASDG